MPAKKAKPKSKKRDVVPRRSAARTVPALAPVRTVVAPRRNFYRSVTALLRTARQRAYRAVNFTMVEAYWNVGRMIVEEEQQGRERADYGAFLIRNLAIHLTEEMGKGFGESNLLNFRQFFLRFPPQTVLDAGNGTPVETTDSADSQIPDALRRELTWTHYRLLMRVESPAARGWYANEAADQNWSTRALQRQIGTLHYERLLMSRDKAPVAAEAHGKTEALPARVEDFIRDPYVLEFLGLSDSASFRESDLEQAIVDKLQAFLLELGKGFAFVARQQRVRTKTKDFFVDLVFYNYVLKCFVLIDLKTGELTHQDIGQMDMYVRMFEDTMRGDEDNPTVGVILCTSKDETVVKYSVLNENKRLFASRYRLFLPTEEQLRTEVEREREMVVREHQVRYRAKGALA